MHDRAVAAQTSRPGPATKARAAATAREEAFFVAVMAPIEDARGGASRARSDSERLAGQLGRRTAELETVRARVRRETEQRRLLRSELVASRRDRAECGRRAVDMERRLRRLSHRILNAQEEERMRISRDLHDAIGEALTGINVGLAALENEAASSSRDLSSAIALTQRLVARSMKTVHQFAWELRPNLLDDLGLVPALRSYSKTFAERSGVAISVEIEDGFAELDDDGRTALFRVAQGALSNVERHARAKRVRLVLRDEDGRAHLSVKDDGRSFDARRLEASRKPRHLGLLVMRERVEMLGGHFSVDSSPGHGTTIQVDVPRRPKSRG
ncbi:MAG: hypothetical protein H6825_07855 [Planctomycetes bacterium]|nr:hypothetical protein [Planctomycetota bacterium]